MSVFGDGRNHMNYLYEEIESFFNEGGTLEEFYEILHWYFEYNNFKKE